MSHVKLRIRSDDHYEIPSLKNIITYYIIYRQLSYDSKNNCFIYFYNDCKVLWSEAKAKFGSIDGVIRHMETHGKISKDNEKKPDPGLDFSIHDNSSVIIGVDPKINWMFNPDKAGVSLGSIDNISCYDNLQHFDPSSRQFSTKPVKNCRLVMFSAIPLPAVPTGDALQPLNFRLVDAQGTRVTVDPDIRYPGNGGSAPSDPDPNP